MKNCPVCGSPIDENQGICSNCGSVITDDINPVDSIFPDSDDEFNFDAYKDYLSEPESDSASNDVTEEKAVVEAPQEEPAEEIAEAIEEKVEEPAEEIDEAIEEKVEEPAEEIEEEAPSFRIISDNPDVKPVQSVFETEVVSGPELVFEEEKEDIEEETEAEPQETEIIPDEEPAEEVAGVIEEEVKEPVFEIIPEEPAEEAAEIIEEEVKEPVEEVFEIKEPETEEPAFVIDNSVLLESADEENDEDAEDEIEDIFATESTEEPAVEESPKTEYTSSDYLSMTERIRKYQIIPDSLPVDGEEEFDEPEPPRIKESNQPRIKVQKTRVEKKRPKWIKSAIIAVAIILVFAIAAVVLLTNDSVKDKLSSAFNKEPVEHSEVVGKVTLKWVRGKKYSTAFDVLKIDKDELKTMIEKSLKENCTSEYDSLNEHYFGDINGINNYVGYIDNVGIGIIFELTETDNLIKSIYVVADTSSDVNKSETLISEYTVCVLHALGEIDDLSYKNIGMYASSIKLNNFTSVATYTRYNNFVLKKHIQVNYSALIINHGDNSSIKKFAESETLELVNCADEKYLKEQPTEPTTDKVEDTDVTPFDEPVVYEVKTAGDPLRIRKEPSTDSEVLGTFDNGTQIEVFGITDDWAKIMYNNEEAYLAAKFIEKVETE